MPDDDGGALALNALTVLSGRPLLGAPVSGRGGRSHDAKDEARLGFVELVC